MKEAIRFSRCLELIASYDGNIPLSIYLRKYFARNKQMGSTDRKLTRELVYNYFRTGIGLAGLSIPDRLAYSNFIFYAYPDELIKYIVSTHTTFEIADFQKTILEKFLLVQNKFPELNKTDLFPFMEYLSNDIDPEKWIQSFFIRPMVWIRMKNNFQKKIVHDFDQLKIPYVVPNADTNALGFEPSAKITETENYRKGLFEIQDLSSQLTGNFFKPGQADEKWWDCCAGAGGKTLLLLDHYPKINLTVSDIRPAILENLKERITRAGLPSPTSFVADISDPIHTGEKYNVILFDAPCSGSGTWNRTPEIISFFKKEQITAYAEKQKKMLTHIIPSLAANGKIIYITCSVFKQENEAVVKHVLDHSHLQLEHAGIIGGYETRSDSMFVAVLKQTE